MPLEAVVDVRSEDAFLSCHLIGSINIPYCELTQRLYELPECSIPIDLIVDDDCGADEDEINKMKWKVNIIKWSDLLNDTREEFLEAGEPTEKARLWQPTPLLVRKIEEIENELQERGLPLTCCDIGCGHGRDIAFLTSRGWEVTGVDNRQPLLDHAVDLSERFSGKSIVAVNADLKKTWPFPPQSFSLVLVVRFLIRDLLEKITNTVGPNGFLLYSHFLDGCQLISTPKSPAHYFLRGELRNLVTRNDEFDVSYEEEANLSDGRPVCVFFFLIVFTYFLNHPNLAIIIKQMTEFISRRK